MNSLFELLSIQHITQSRHIVVRVSEFDSTVSAMAERLATMLYAVRSISAQYKHSNVSTLQNKPAFENIRCGRL